MLWLICFFYRDPEETEKEDQTDRSGQDRDAQQRQMDYDDGPSIMPASESFAGNQDNWGASATDSWGAANAGTGGADTSDWNAPTAATTGTSTGWIS